MTARARQWDLPCFLAVLVLSAVVVPMLNRLPVPVVDERLPMAVGRGFNTQGVALGMTEKEVKRVAGAGLEWVNFRRGRLSRVSGHELRAGAELLFRVGDSRDRVTAMLGEGKRVLEEHCFGPPVAPTERFDFRRAKCKIEVHFLAGKVQRICLSDGRKETLFIDEE